MPRDPRLLTTRDFDYYRPSGVPAAKVLRETLNDDLTAPLGWQHLVRLSLLDHPARLRVLQRCRQVPYSPRQRRLLVLLAVRKAAVALDTDTLSEEQYMRVRRRLRRLPPHQQTAVWLPTAGGLQRLVEGDWSDVLTAARLPTLAPGARQPPEPPNLQGLPIVDAVVCFYRINGYMPSRTTLEDFMADCNARLANQQRGVPWAAYLQQARDRLQAEGRAVGSRGPRPGQAVIYRLPPGSVVPGAPPARRNRKTTVTRLRCMTALRHFVVEQRRAGRPVTRAEYLVWRRGTDWPAPSSFAKRGGGFGHMLKQVAGRSEWVPHTPEERQLKRAVETDRTSE